MSNSVEVEILERKEQPVKILCPSDGHVTWGGYHQVLWMMEHDTERDWKPSGFRLIVNGNNTYVAEAAAILNKADKPGHQINVYQAKTVISGPGRCTVEVVPTYPHDVEDKD